MGALVNVACGAAQEIDVSTMSGGVCIGADCEKLSVETASGYVNISGGYWNEADITTVSGAVDFTGTARELSRSRAAQLTDELAVGERKELTVLFHYPKEAGNATQMQSLSFRLMADAVQTKNNPSREF